MVFLSVEGITHQVQVQAKRGKSLTEVQQGRRAEETEQVLS